MATKIFTTTSSLLASTATEMVVTLLTTVACIFLIFLLMKGIKREKIKFLAMSEGSHDLNQGEMRQVMARAIQKPKCEFVLIEIAINDIENLEKVCGESQFKMAVEEMLQKVKYNLPASLKVAIIDKERIWLLIKDKIKKEALDLMLKRMIIEIKKPIVLIGDLQIQFEVNVAAVIYERGLKDVQSIEANLELTSIVSKKRGHNTAVIFNRSISNISSEEYELFIEIKEAIKNNDFRVFYQPIVYSDSLECYAVEAYLRWQHAEKGIISPDIFMPSLEHSGDINWVGLWAFESIAKQLEYWRINNPEEKVKININWSLSQLTNPQLGEKLKAIYKKYKVSSADFIFEIPSYKEAMSIEVASRNINFFRQMGIGIAIDNLNLEVNTIAELGNNDIHMLKFNRDFVNKLCEDNATVKSVAEMIAKNSAQKQILVAGEGIENEEMLDKLKEIGIPLAQGYYFSRPKAPTECMADIVLTPWKK